MRRGNIVFAWAVACALCASAQVIRFPRSQRSQRMPDFTVTATARFEPATPVVGEGCMLLLELDVDRTAALDKVHVRGLPEGKDVPIVYGSFENLADGKSATEGRVVKRMRLPMRFQKPFSRQVLPTVEGMVGTVQGGMSFFQNFGQRLAPLRFEARALPEAGRPADFSGAVGRKFSVKQSLSRDHVRLNKEFVTVTYTLECDDYCPENVFPDIGQFPKGFKVYPPKEVERTRDQGTSRVTWKQTVIPLTEQATNTASVSINYYNPQTKRYEVAHADPLPLAFVSAEADSSENTRVAVTGLAATQKTPAGKGDGVTTQALVLHFAPSVDSPAVMTIDAGTPVKELATWNGWRRLEAPNAIGWTRSN